jgi:hypothetical protein
MPRQASKRAFVHRDLKFDQHDHQTGADVKALQRAINARAKDRGIRPALVVDGDCGRQTIAKGRQVARSLGLSATKPGLSKAVQFIIRNPKLRTPAQRSRAKTYKPPVPTSQPKVKGNTVTGGTGRQRVVAGLIHAAYLYYSGKARRFYSQAGRYTVDSAITGEQPGERSDCSQFKAGIHHSAGLPDPNDLNYTGGYTGSLSAEGKPIARIDLEPGDDVFYGPPPHHHIEGWVGNGDGITTYRQLADPSHPDHELRDRTVGHGSPPVDYGDIDMIADPRFSRPRGLS